MKTLFVLPNAIGDVISGLGAAMKLREQGEVVWVVNRLARAIPESEGFATIVPPSPRVRQMKDFGAPTEVLRRTAESFLKEVRGHGPFDLVVNPHLSRASCLIAGAASAKEHRGPALSTERVLSDPWSDYFTGAITSGSAPECQAWVFFSILSGLTEPALPRLASPRREASDEIIFQPVAGWPAKTLPPEQAARIFDLLSAHGEVALLGGPGDTGYFDEMSLLASRPAVFRPATVKNNLQRICEARLVVATDTWTLHAAAAAETPFLGLMGPTRIFPPGKGWVLAPAEEGSWARDGDASIGVLAPVLIAASAGRILRGETPDPPADDDEVILWDASPLFARPHRPIPSAGRHHERRVFSWAKAAAFNDLVQRHAPDSPSLPLRSAENMAIIYAELPAIRKAILADWQNWIAKFMLFETTFPGMNAELLLDEWIERAQRRLDAF